MKTIQATITRIDHKKHGNGAQFQRVYFTPDDPRDGSWCKTDLCPTYRNWSHWAGKLEVGNTLSNLILKNSTTIDADCWPKLVIKPKAPEQGRFDL